ncbi:MAG: biopolymer transporter ExbD [Deltaproteobacteria bacterium]|nr:biopolymer transporter ExbD [Deltaproteobacteria bacterium]
MLGKKVHRHFGKKVAEEDVSPTRLNLTALMDILSNIIFFLMASFGAQTLELTSASKVTLPASTSELSFKMSINVAVGMEELFVEDEPVGKLEQGKLVGLTPDRFHPKLEETLKRSRAQRLAKNERAKDEDDIILLVADKRLKFETLDRVMKTCARAGFTRFRFAVSKR